MRVYAGERTGAEARVEIGECLADIGQAAVELVERRPQPQHQGRVDHVLAGGADMQMAGVGSADRGAHLADQLGHDDAVAGRGFDQSGAVGGERGERRLDRLGRGGRDDAVLGRGGGQRRLEADHRRQLRRLVEQRGDVGIAKQ